MSALTVNVARQSMAATAADAAAVGVFSSDDDTVSLPSPGRRRRATRRGEPDPVQRAMLFLNPEGVLEWHLGAGEETAPARGRRTAAPLPPAPDGDLVDVFEFESLDANEVVAFLERVDTRLNDRFAAGRLWRLQPPPAAGAPPTADLVKTPLKGKKRRLLLVHGTFSKASAVLESITAARNGQAFFDRIFAHYQEVVAFEHPTLSVSPVLNALDLQRELAGIEGDLDVVAHSRGGLIVRWAFDVFGVPAARTTAVLVGAPLGGTSLASPPRLKASLGLLTNIGTALKASGAAAAAFTPFLLTPLALLKVATAVAGTVAGSPLLDGAIAMVPGLAAQSRVSNNQELKRLLDQLQRPSVRYYVVSSDFRPSDPGWKFWEWFRGRRLADAAADRVFPGQNDLVVDTDSMSELPARAGGTLAFGSNATVHHTNYFEQPGTLSFILKSLKVP